MLFDLFSDARQLTRLLAIHLTQIYKPSGVLMAVGRAKHML